MRAGYDPRNLADALGVPISEVLKDAPQVEYAGSLDEEELRSSVRAVGYRALTKAIEILEDGSPKAQMQMIQSILRPMLYVARDTSGADRKLDELRDTFTQFMADIVEPEEADDEPDTAGQPTVDSRQGGEAAAPPAELGAKAGSG